MTLLISHRGNIFGKNISNENSIKQIEYCLNQNLNVEIDVWSIDGNIFLGHDGPQYAIPEKFLENQYLWCHAKNSHALFSMIENPKIHCFWHDRDSYTITSRGFVWAYPGQTINHRTVCVLPELYQYSDSDLNNSYAICTDNIAKYLDICKK